MHTVTDPGHSHLDRGHRHSYNKASSYRQIQKYSIYYLENTFYHDDMSNSNQNTGSSKADIQTSRTNIGVTTVSHAKAGSETRPINMAVVWIMRIH